MIQSMISLANSLEQLWDRMTLVVKQMPQKKGWKRKNSRKEKSHTFNAGFVGTLTKRMDSHGGIYIPNIMYIS